MIVALDRGGWHRPHPSRPCPPRRIYRLVLPRYCESECARPKSLAPDRLCAVVAARSAAAAIEQLRVAKNTAKARVVELRLDFLAGRAQIDTLLSWVARQPRKPILIATCRRLPAGGRFKGSIEAEIAILRRAVEAGCRWCDVEIETARADCPRTVEKQSGAFAPARLGA